MDEQLLELKNKSLQIYNNLSDKEKQLFEYDKCVLCDGPIDSKIVVVARDLGREEIQKGVPLIGAAGLLFRFVETGLGCDSFLCNTVPFKPVGNKSFPLEIRHKFKIIIECIIRDIIKPKAVIVIGNEALETFVYPRYRGITQYANEDGFEVDYCNHKLMIFPIVHPSYLIRQGLTLKSLKESREHNRMFKELFFRNIYRAHKFVENIE